MQSVDGAFWRRLASLGSAHGPEWLLRVAPGAVGLAACALAGPERRAVTENLRSIRGPRGALRDTLDAARTFTSYAACLAETLGAGSARARPPRAVVWGEEHVLEATSDHRGVIFATAHTGGWEAVGALLSRDHGWRLMIAEAAERDRGAGDIQDRARRAAGLLVVHVGDDPLSGLALVRHLGDRGVVAVQVDRAPARMRARAVTLFGGASQVPEGPLRLAMLTGAPIVPIFAARSGHRRYVIVASAPIRLARTAGNAELDAAAQKVADAMQAFLCAHPTQWFHFRSRVS